MEKEFALTTIIESAKLYKENLESKNLLFLFTEKNNIQCLETRFKASRFLHLTGVDVNKNRISADFFYRMCINNRLSLNDFSFKKNGTTELKIEVLKQLMNISKVTKMIGDYNHTKPILYTDKVAGGVNACLGFIKEDNYYVPNTALKEDIRDVTQSQSRVIAILAKDIREQKYNQITYTVKGIDFWDIKLPSEISKLIDMPQTHVMEEIQSAMDEAATMKDDSKTGIPKPSVRAKLEHLKKMPGRTNLINKKHEEER